MPRTKGKGKLRSKTPRRVKRRRTGQPRSLQHRTLQHPELWGLALVALGLFLGSVVYAGWNGGYVGRAFADGLDALIGGASWVVPVAFVVLGGLMVGRRALVDFRPFPVSDTWDEPPPLPPARKPVVDAEAAYPDVVEPIPLAESPLYSMEHAPLVAPQEQLFEDVTSEHAEYRLPDRDVLRTAPEKAGTSEETSARVADLLVQTLAHFGVDATVVGQISGPRVTRYELTLAPGPKVSKAG